MGFPPGAFPAPAYVTPLMAQQNEQLRQFWHQQMQEIMQVGTDPAEFKNHQLPLARIKKVCTTGLDCPCPREHTTQALLGSYLKGLCSQIMKSDEDVRMISAEAPVLFARVRARCLLLLLGQAP